MRYLKRDFVWPEDPVTRMALIEQAIDHPQLSRWVAERLGACRGGIVRMSNGGKGTIREYVTKRPDAWIADLEWWFRTMRTIKGLPHEGPMTATKSCGSDAWAVVSTLWPSSRLKRHKYLVQAHLALLRHRFNIWGELR